LRCILSEYQVLTAGTLSEALQMAQSGPVDLYVLTWWLPDGTGLELCRQIRAFYLHAPVLICSTDARPAAEQQARATGAQAYLTKPYEPEVLRQTVGRLLNWGEEPLAVSR
jgi:CheY-like chemotaxis protein